MHRRKRSYNTLFILGGIVIVFLLFLIHHYVRFLFPTVARVVFHHEPVLKETNGHTNVLLLGIGGGTHDGPDLTDTIMFASITPKTKKVTLISIPRDLWVMNLHSKINAAYHAGQADGKHDGLVVVSRTVEKILNQPVHYTVVVDFNGFVKAVDLLGGLDVSVQNTFDDYQYPITGKEAESCGHTEEEIQALTASEAAELDAFPCRYMHLHFDQGVTHMDGSTALMFVRSRHAEGIEGSDFSRSKRQEKIIQAVKEKLFSAQTIFNPSKLISLYTLLKDSINTNVKEEEFSTFIKLAQVMKDATFHTAILDTGDESQGREGLLINPPITSEYGYAWVLAPASGNFTAIHSYVACQLEGKNCPKPKKVVDSTNDH